MSVAFPRLCPELALVRASYTCAKTAGDGRASFVRRHAESGGYIEQDGLHVAVGECLGRDEATEAKCSEVQSGVALADRGLQELLFFRSERGRGVATMRPGWREWWSGSRCGESLEQPGRQAGQGNLVRSGAILPGIDVAGAVHGTDRDDISPAAAHVQAWSEFSRGVFQVGAWIGEVQVLAGPSPYFLPVRTVCVSSAELTCAGEA